MTVQRVVRDDSGERHGYWAHRDGVGNATNILPRFFKARSGSQQAMKTAKTKARFWVKRSFDKEAR